MPVNEAFWSEFVSVNWSDFWLIATGLSNPSVPSLARALALEFPLLSTAQSFSLSRILFRAATAGQSFESLGRYDLLPIGRIPIYDPISRNFVGRDRFEYRGVVVFPDPSSGERRTTEFTVRDPSNLSPTQLSDLAIADVVKTESPKLRDSHALGLAMQQAEVYVVGLIRIR